MGIRKNEEFGSNMVRIELFGIQSIDEIGEEDVYDISMGDCDDFFQNEHNYIANNIVVHNCHASGILVSDVPLKEIAPLRTARKEVLATQFPYEDLELLGLIKFDILAISTLSVVKKTLELIKKNYDIEIDIETLELNDKKTYELYKSGNLGGVFQCENWGMQKTMKDIEVDCFEDVVAAIALYRPGPMENIPQYCARKRKEEKISYFHTSIEPFVKPYLENTYGIAIYQESIMQICNSLAGFDISDGYMMIKAIGKKKKYLMEKFEDQFISGCVKNKVDKEVAKQYWEKFIVPFAGYGFNRCLDGGMCVKNKVDNQIYTVEELEKQIIEKEIILDSYYKNNVVEDKLVDVFETGEKDIYEIELENGIVLRSTMDHKFMCSDNKMHTIEEINKYDLGILYFDNG